MHSFEMVTFNTAATLSFDDVREWMKENKHALGFFQEVSDDWTNSVNFDYGIVVGERGRGGRRCAVVWRLDTFKAKRYFRGDFPAVLLEHHDSGVTLEAVSAHLAHSGYELDIFQEDLL